MWFLGLAIGAFVGAIGDGPGLVTGAILGAIAGWLFSDAAKTEKQRHARLDAIIDQLSDRVRALEDKAAAVPVTESGQSAATELTRQPSVGAASPEPSPLTPTVPDISAEPADAGEATAAYEPQHSEPEPPRSGVEFRPRDESRSALTRASPLWDFFFGGNALVRGGVIVLFFGVAFLLKYASEHIEIPVEARLIGVALCAVAMLAIGWRLRSSRPGYGLIMQGGGIGVLYLTVFAAYRLYDLLPAGVVFALLAAMAVFSALLAVFQDARSLAAMGVSGGFLAPILASTGGGSHVALFSFYALLNLGILMIACLKPWRSLNLLGFAFTFIIGLVWGDRYYRSEFLTSTEPFLILFFLFYVAIAVLFALRQDASVRSPVDGTLVFGTPLIAFGLQTALVRDIEYATAFSALALSGFYLLLAKSLVARLGGHGRLLFESFLALGTVFGTLAIPLALDGRWTAAAWALEGAAIVWIGVRQEKPLARAFGVFLQFAAGVAFFFAASGSRGALPVLNSFYLGCVFVAVAALFSARYLKHRPTRPGGDGAMATTALFCWGCAWWLGGAVAEIHDQIPHAYRLHAVLFFVIASCAAFSVLHRRIDWLEAKYAALALLALMYAAAAVEIDRVPHPFAYLGFIVWPLAFGANFWLLRRHEETPRIGWWHAAGLWLAVALGAWEAAWWIGELVRGSEVWALVGWPIVPIALLIWLSDRGPKNPWPVARYPKAYLFEGAILLAGFLWLWMLYANFISRGDPSPLPFFPLLNPLDLAQSAALLALCAWLRRLRSLPFAPPLFQTAATAFVALGSIAFLWLNGALLRTLHHWAGVPFDPDAMMRSMLVQASLSIFWTLLALCAMVAATRFAARRLWITGAGLMAIVVVKLFFIDLSNIGGIERIVSFLGVGLLMLVVGYFSPVPPATTQEEK